MKNYDETIESVFSRINEYEIRKSQRKKVMTKTAVSVCCVCLVALVGLGVQQFYESPVTPQVSEPVHSDVGSTIVSPDPNNQIIIHTISSDPDTYNIALMWHDFIPLSREEALSYYGTNVFPTVPSDLSARDKACGIFKRDGGIGQLYWDQNQLQYFNETSSRGVSLTFRKGSSPFFDFLIHTPGQVNSIINGTEVAIGITSDGCYYAEFMYNNTGFGLYTEGLTQEETVIVIASLLQ